MKITAKTEMRKLKAYFAGYPEHLAVVTNDVSALDAALTPPNGDIDIGRHAEKTAETPISLAIRLNQSEMVGELIRRGADLHNVPLGADLPVVVAAQQGSGEVMAMLMQANVDISVKYQGNKSLCHLAAANGDATVLQMLLRAGVSCDDVDDDGKRPIHIAALNENEQVTAMLLAAGCAAGGAILAAAANANANVVRMLITAGDDVNVNTPLYTALANPNEQVLDALLAAGAEWPSDSGAVCRAAAANTNAAIVRRVLERGVEINARDELGFSALLIAAHRSSAQVVQLLLDAGADVGAISNDLTTACQSACWNKNAGVMSVLLAAGAPISRVAVQFVLLSGNLDHMRVFVDAGVDLVGEFNASAELVTFVDRETLEFLARLGVNFRSVGEIVYFLASVDSMAAMFARGVDLNGTHVQFAQNDVLIMLIAAGIDVSTLHCRSLADCPVLAAASHPHWPAHKVSWRELGWACSEIAQKQFDLLRLRAMQVCVGLHAANLPALVACEILAHTFAPLECLVAFHRLWAIATKIKHFQSGGKPQV